MKPKLDPNHSYSPPLHLLSKREREILALLAQGLSTPEIADRLFRSPKTVDSHRANLARKLRANNRVQLTRIAIAGGLVPSFDPGATTKREGHRASGTLRDDHALPLESILEIASAAHMAFWDWEIESGRVRVSANLLLMLGYKPSEFTAHTSSWQKIVHSDDRAFVDAETQRRLGAGERLYELEYRMIDKEGTARPFRVTCMVIANRTGRPMKVLGISQDLGEQARAKRPRVGTDSKHAANDRALARNGTERRAPEPP